MIFHFHDLTQSWNFIKNKTCSNKKKVLKLSYYFTIISIFNAVNTSFCDPVKDAKYHFNSIMKPNVATYLFSRCFKNEVRRPFTKKLRLHSKKRWKPPIKIIEFFLLQQKCSALDLLPNLHTHTHTHTDIHTQTHAHKHMHTNTHTHTHTHTHIHTQTQTHTHLNKMTTWCQKRDWSRGKSNE